MTTIFHTKIYTIILAAEESLLSNWQGRTLQINSNSQRSLTVAKENAISSQSISNWHQMLLKICRLNDKFVKLAAGLSDQFVWMKPQFKVVGYADLPSIWYD